MVYKNNVTYWEEIVERVVKNRAKSFSIKLSETFTVKKKKKRNNSVIQPTFEKDEILEQIDTKARYTCFSKLLKKYFQYYLIFYL